MLKKIFFYVIITLILALVLFGGNYLYSKYMYSKYNEAINFVESSDFNQAKSIFNNMYFEYSEYYIRFIDLHNKFQSFKQGNKNISSIYQESLDLMNTRIYDDEVLENNIKNLSKEIINQYIIKLYNESNFTLAYDVAFLNNYIIKNPPLINYLNILKTKQNNPLQAKSILEECKYIPDNYSGILESDIRKNKPEIISWASNEVKILEQKKQEQEEKQRKEAKIYEQQLLIKQKEEKAKKKSQGVSLGMTKQDVLDSAWGEPNDINRTITNYGMSEQW